MKSLSMFHIVYIVLIIPLSLAVFSVTQAGNFTVSNLSQLQTALNTAAANGESDTINVTAGTYDVNPTLTYISAENYFLLIRGIGSPVFDGGNSRQIIQLTTTSAAGNIFVEGLTIQHGQADYGGGMNVVTESAEIVIYNCTFNDNTAGVVCGGANLTSSTGNITIADCTFRRNASPNATGYPYGTAGGLFVQTDGSGTVIRMTGCTFEENIAERDAAGAMLYPLGSNSTIIAEFNTCNNNTSKEFGGGCWIRGPGGNTIVRYMNNTLTGNTASVAGSGGGTYIEIASGSIDLYDNVHIGNSAVWQGGGLWIEQGGGSINVYRNRFTDNTTTGAGGGANIFLDNGIVQVNHNVFYENGTSGIGGGLNISTTTGDLDIFNNTFYLNNSDEGSDVYLYFDNASSTSDFFNNILYSSSLPALAFSGQQSVTARYSDIQGGGGQSWFGTGCIDAYPFFVDTVGANFHLQDSMNCGNQRYSPCIDAGDPAVQDTLMDCNLGLGEIRSDMGAYGGRIPNIVGIRNLETNILDEYHLFQNFPNPFNPSTKIKYSVPQSSDVVIKVFDILGNEIKTFINDEKPAGTYELNWNAEGLPSGIYFYQLRAGYFIETKKMILLK